jgi:hypothetical protein
MAVAEYAPSIGIIRTGAKGLSQHAAGSNRRRVPLREKLRPKYKTFPQIAVARHYKPGPHGPDVDADEPVNSFDSSQRSSERAMLLKLRSFAPLLGALTVALAGCQVAPPNPESSAEAAAQAPDQSEPGAAPAAPGSQAPAPAPKLTPATNSPATFFIGETHSAPNLTAVKMIDGTRLYLEREPVLRGEDISQANDLVDKQGRHFIGVRFTKAGASKLADVSAKSKGKRLVLIINGRVEAAPVIGEQLDHGVLAFGVPSAMGAASLAARIRGEQPPGLKFKPAGKSAAESKEESDPKADPKHEAKHEAAHKAESRHKVQPRHKAAAKPKSKTAPKHVVKHKAPVKAHATKPAAKPASQASEKKTGQPAQ